MERIFLWVLLSVITAVLANNKGRSVAGWFFVGMLLGPLGLVLVLMVSKDEAALEQRSLASGELKKCPYCAEIVKAEAQVCKYCRKDLAP